MTTPVTHSLRMRRPLIHEGGQTCAGLAWTALGWLEDHVEPGMETLETGAGLSTIVFAASGATHIVVTPEAAEEAAVRAACEEFGISAERVEFVIGPSEEVLPVLPKRELDLALIDGAHGFPYAILDWWQVGRRLRLGGRIVLDDAYLPPVLAILDGLRGVPSWRVEGPISDRTVVIQKLSDELPPGVWPGGPFGGRQSFRYLPARRRYVAAARQRVLQTPLGEVAVGARRALRSRLSAGSTGSGAG
jgi:8-oxo-dGTP pyrophosphatase MutT (NUDIX family)